VSDFDILSTKGPPANTLFPQSLLSIFRPRTGTDRDRETTIERVDVSADDGMDIKSRLIAKIICRNGTTDGVIP
jgi:cell cycle checkpoint control protein RAD9A